MDKAEIVNRYSGLSLDEIRVMIDREHPDWNEDDREAEVEYQDWLKRQADYDAGKDDR